MHEHQLNEHVPALSEQHSEKEPSAAWREVGTQFEILGNKLAGVIKRSWQASGRTESSTETMRNLRDDLREAANRVDGVMNEAAEETRDERQATLRATRRASEQSLEEARVLTAATLRRLNRQLDLLASRLEDDDSPSK